MDNLQDLERLEEAVAAPSFLRLLKECAQRGLSGRKGPLQHPHELPLHEFGPQTSARDSHSPVDGPTDRQASSGSGGGGSDGDFVVLEKDDAVQAQAYYIAVYISQSPEAQAMTPQQLQEALTTTLKGLKNSKFKRMWTLGRYTYRWAALSYSALQMWQNPWLVQAVFAGLCAASRVAVARLL